MPYQLGETPIYNNMKYLNYVVYIPGLAGKFTQFLISLHLTTRPFVVPGTTIIDTSVNRFTLYSYKDLYTRHGSWGEHHRKIFDEFNDQLYNEFLNSNYTHYNYCNHPHEFYLPPFHRQIVKKYPNIKKIYTNRYVCAMLQNKIQQEHLQVRYLQMAVSEQYQPMIDEFKVKNGNFPSIRPDEENKNSQFTKDYNPYVINLDNYFIGESNFLEEYTKLMNHLGIPTQDELALELYRDWIEARTSIPNVGAPSRNRTGMPLSERF